MTDQFNLNGVDIDLKPIKELVNNNEKILAIKHVIDLTDCRLIVAKNFVEQLNDLQNFDPNIQGISNSNEGVSVSNSNGKINVTYKTGKSKKNVTPADIEWKRVKAILPNNQTILQYEKQFSEGKININQTLIQRNKGFFYDFSGIKKVLTILIIIILIIVYLEFFR